MWLWALPFSIIPIINLISPITPTRPSCRRVDVRLGLEVWTLAHSKSNAQTARDLRMVGKVVFSPRWYRCAVLET